MIDYVLDVMYFTGIDWLLDDMNDGYNGGLVDRLQFGKIDKSITILIDNKLDVWQDLVLDLVQDGVGGMSPGSPLLPLLIKS